MRRAASGWRSRKALELADAGLQRLIPVELGVLAQHRVTEHADIASDCPPASAASTSAAAGPTCCSRSSSSSSVRYASLAISCHRWALVRQARGRNVEEPVQVDAQRGVVQPARQLG